ncbi:MAG: phosphate--AMP phosphotransferase [Spirochaetes bacterium GWF1_51_8]|nr:MAG: phosphate--AMP phosphotransferase [Spirochaetes bacterium GWF1_51_8]
MLENIELSKKMNKDEYKKVMPGLTIELAALQREATQFGIPVMIVFEGWDAAGKGTLINRLIMPLDPRGFKVHPTSAPNEEERHRPFLWRFWTKIPAKGRLAIFDRSWYGRVLVERVDKLIGKDEVRSSIRDINSFERMLNDDGYLVIKLFLHISKETQKKRFEKLENNSSTKWKVNKDDWRHHKQYGKYYRAASEMLDATDTASAGWVVVEAEDEEYAVKKVYDTVIGALKKRIAEIHAHEKKKARAPEIILDRVTGSALDRVDLTVVLDKAGYETRVKKCQKRVRELEHEIYAKRIPVIVMYEGWDAAGKGGNIRRLTQNMDPRGYEVFPIAAPSSVELAHHYLWRFWNSIPKAGHIGIFDRTWYGRVLVERIEGFSPEPVWKRAFREINEAELHLAEFGTVLIKFWLHISPEEQLARFEERQNTVHKQWKITEEDWRNREKWDKYKEAVDETIYRTSTEYAPWTILEANCKYHARIKALETFIETVEKAVERR